MTNVTQQEVYSKTAGSLSFLSGAGYGSTSSGVVVDYNSTANSCYYCGMYFSSHIGTSKIQLHFNESVIMWSQAASGAINYDSNMLLFKLNADGATWYDVSDKLISVKGRTDYNFYINLTVLDPGTYEFRRSDEFATGLNFDPYYGLRADNKWFFEKVE